MFNSNIPYSFNQFESSIISLCAYLKLKVHELAPNIPVFIMNSGDFSYFVEKKFVEVENKEIYLKTPRIVIKIEDIQQNQSEDTNQYNAFIYKFDNKIYRAVVRRKAYNIQVMLNFVSPNFITALNHMELMATLTAHDNVFTYDFLGNTCQSAFTIQQSGNEVPSIDMSQGGSRNVSTMYNLELQTHLLVPRPESIQLLDDYEIETIHDDIIVKNFNKDDNYETSLERNKFQKDCKKSPNIEILDNGPGNGLNKKYNNFTNT